MLHRFLKSCEIDRGVMYALLARSWQTVAGLVTLLLIARFFTPELQGFYYTFLSIIALQTFVELGFYLVIVNVASHEWAHLQLDHKGCIVGQPEALSRLVSLGRLIFKWYAVASFIFIVIVGLAGYIFFSQSFQNSIRWQGPWITLVFLSGLSLCTLPYISLLEGCNQVVIVNQFRLVQALLAYSSLWLIITLNGGLWGLVALTGVNFLSCLYLLLYRYRYFFEPFLKPPAGRCIVWRSDIWPMQSRIAISGLVNYFAFSLFNPVMFRYHGPVVAGQMGMCWQIVSAVQGTVSAWISAKVPLFGRIIAQRDYAKLDRLWRRSLVPSFVMVSGGVMLLWLLIYSFNNWQIPLARRLLPPLPTGLFFLAVILMQISQWQTGYLRAHKQEPIMIMSIVCSLAIGFLVWLLGSRFGPVGAAAAYLGVVVASVVWETAIWRRCRTIWHEE